MQVVKQRPLVIEYIRHLLFGQLKEEGLEEVLDSLRRLPRQDPLVRLPSPFTHGRRRGCIRRTRSHRGSCRRAL